MEAPRQGPKEKNNHLFGRMVLVRKSALEIVWVVL